MRIEIGGCEAIVFITTMVLTLLAPVLLLVTGQPQGYTLIYSAPRAYAGADWMDIKALYMKTEENRLFFYVEYYGEIPNSRDYYRCLYIYMDTDRNIQTGSLYNELGRDYYIYFQLYGDNSSSSATLYRWNSTSRSWKSIKDLRQNAKLAPGLSYMEIWVDQQDIGYTPSGIDFYLSTYSYVKAMPKTELSYVIGSSVKQITVDGDASDWGTIAPLATFPSRSINPPELEVSNIYVANDDETLYVRIDTRGAPTPSINTGSLNRYLYLYFDTDNNDDTGYIYRGGAEFEAYIYFNANPGKSTGGTYYRYTGTGEDSNWQSTSPSSPSDFNSVFEAKIPLSYLELGPGQQVGLYLEDRWWYLYRTIPKPVYSTTYPPATTATTTGGIISFFGSETVFIAVVAVAMIVEAVLIILLMRRGRAPIPPPPPPPA